MEVCFFDVTATTGTDPYWRTRSLHGALPILGGAADGHQIGALVPGDGVRRGGAAFGLADAGEQALVQHHVHEFVHAGRGRGARGADDLLDRKSTRLNSSMRNSYAVFCLKKKSYHTHGILHQISRFLLL